MNIATLTIEMAANVARLRQDMDNAASVVQSATAKMQKAAELAGKALGLLGVGLSVSAFTGFVRNAIDAADALDEMSGRIGVSAKELSGLQLAYRQAGMGNEAMASSLAKLSREMSEGNAGLRALGVNTRNADGSLRGTTAVLLDVADKFTTLEDGAAKTALAVEIFGKSGTEMVPLLNSGSEGIAQMTAMAEKLGLVIEDETAAQAGQFNDTLELLGLGVQGVGSRIAAQLLPTLTNLTGSFLESMTSGDRLKSVADFLAASLKILYTVGVGIVEVFSTVGKTLGAAMGQVLAILRGDFAAASEIGKAWKEDVTAGWSATSSAIKAAWATEGNAAVTSAATQVKVSKDLLAEQKAREEQAKKTAAAAAKAADEAAKKAADGAKLAASLLAQDSGLQGDFAEKWDKLNAAYADNKISLEDLTQAQKKLLEQQPLMKKAFEDAAKNSQSAADARKAEADGIAAWMQAQQQAAAQTLASVNSRVRSLQEEERAAKLARETNISLAEAVELVAIARLQEEQAGLHEEGTRYKEIEREIAARRELVQMLGQQNVRQREEQGWSDMWASVDRTAHDVFVNIFDGGSNVFKKLGQTLKASVLDVLYQMTIRKWIINIGTSIFGGGFGGAAAAGAASSGGGLLGSAGTSILGNMMGGASALGIGASYGFQSLFANGLGATLSAGSSMIGAGSVMSGLGTIAGALGPIALGVGAVVSLIKGLDDSGTIHTGALSEYSAKGGLQNSTTHGAFGMGFGGVDYSAETEKFTGAMAQSIVSMLDSTATTFGKDAGYRAATAFADDTSKDGAWGGLLISRLEETIVNWDADRSSKWAPREFADGAAGKEQYLAAVAQDVRAALDSIGLPGWATSMLDKLGDGASLEQLAGVVDQINAAKGAFAAFGQYMPIFGSLADSTLERLVDASGGVGALSSNMSSFVATFYSDAERLEVASVNLSAEFAKLGLEVPRTKEEFRDLVQAQLALGDAGADTVARLLALGDAFASVVDGSSSLDSSLGITAETIAGILDAAIEQAGSAQEASRLASQAFEEQVYGGMRDNMLGGLSDMLMGAINPMISSLVGGAAASSAALAAGGAAAAGSLVAGGSMSASASASGGAAAAGAMASGGSAAAGALVSGGAAAGSMVNSVLDQARAYVSAYSQIMSDPQVQAMITEISGLVGGVAGTAYDGLSSWGGGGGGAWQSPGSPSAPSAADDYNDALKSIGNTLEEEVKRLRGLMVTDSDQSRAVLEAQFASATAAARAGDQTALAQLPSISKQLEKATEDSATSAVEVARMRGWLAGSITETMKLLGLDVPKFDVGTNYVPRDMLAMIHEGEAIVPKAFNPAAGGVVDMAASFAPARSSFVGDYGAELVSEMRGVRRELSALREQGNSNTLAVQRLNLRSVKTLERVENILAMQK